MADKVYKTEESNGMTKYYDSGGNVLGYTYRDSDGLTRVLDKNMRDTGDRSFLDPSTGMTKVTDSSGELKGYNYRDANGMFHSTVSGNSGSGKKDPESSGGPGTWRGGLFSDGNRGSESKAEGSSIWDAFRGGDSDNTGTSGSAQGRTPSERNAWEEIERQTDEYLAKKAETASHLKREEREHERPSRAETLKFAPKENCTAELAREFLDYTAYLLYKNGVKPGSYVSEEYIHTDHEKRGPFGIFRKRVKKKQRMPAARYWELRDAEESISNAGNDLIEYDRHTYTCLYPGGRVMSRKTEYKVYSNETIFLEAGLEELSVDRDPSAYAALASCLLSKNGIDMSFDRYVKERNRITFDDSYVEQTRKDLQEERKRLQRPKVTDDRVFNDLHWIAAVIFLIAFFTTNRNPGWIIYFIQAFLFFAAYQMFIKYDESGRLRPESPSIGFEVLVSVMTGFTMLVKNRFNVWFYHNVYDNSVPMMFLAAIIGVMGISAMIKQFGKAGNEKGAASSGKKLLLRIAVAAVIIASAVLRIKAMMPYDSDHTKYSVILLMIEAGSVIAALDWKIPLGLYLLYGIINYSDELWFFRPGDWKYTYKLPMAGVA
ncbi:MAG: hypothetical protein IKX27_08095, partial [Oscillospiraceae bacterium]|nr:hypothetical protein [Oscillospiraceae bacterium]